MTFQCVLDLCENPLEVFVEASKILLRLSGNILRDPSNQRYRSVRLANPTVESKLIPANGGIDCLFEMGFQEGEESLVLPESAPLDKVRAVHDQIRDQTDNAPNANNANADNTLVANNADGDNTPVAKNADADNTSVANDANADNTPVANDADTDNTPVANNEDGDNTSVANNADTDKTPVANNADGDNTSVANNADADNTSVANNADGDNTLVAKNADADNTLVAKNADGDNTLVANNADGDNTLVANNADGDNTPVANNADAYNTPVAKNADADNTPVANNADGDNTLVANNADGDNTSVTNNADADNTPVANNADGDNTPVANNSDADNTPVANNADDDNTPVTNNADADNTSVANNADGDNTPVANDADGDNTPVANNADADNATNANNADGDNTPVANNADADNTSVANNADGDNTPVANNADGDNPTNSNNTPKANDSEGANSTPNSSSAANSAQSINIQDVAPLPETTMPAPVVSSPVVTHQPVMASALVTSPPPVVASAIPVLSREEEAKAQFLHHLDLSESLVARYESDDLRFEAQKHIPHKVLHKATNKNLNQPDGPNVANLADTALPHDLVITDDVVLAKTLLRWFKRDFFRWVDRPLCPGCGNVTALPDGRGGGDRRTLMVVPTADELRHGAARVERYICVPCGNKEVRFPRYNDPAILLETRAGRCGEWANCFSLMCRALGYETRYVYDWSDHVWTEIYSEQQNRWIHMDPCEGAFDRPLMYEKGWGKKLSYVIAFSADDVQDVTWRYVTDHEAALSRRKTVPESWLLEEIVRRKSRYTSDFSPERSINRIARTVTELAGFLSCPGQEYQRNGKYWGRTTGSEQWRQARGEMGATKGSNTPALRGAEPSHVGPNMADMGGACCKRGAKSNMAATHQPHTWELTAGQIESRLFILRYCTATDTYLQGNVGQVKGWQNGVHECSDIFRKEEHDWGMVYLARTEGSKKGVIHWKLSFEGTGLVVDDIEVKVSHTLFEDGLVMWLVCSEETCTRLPGAGVHRLDESGIRGASSVTVKANLSRGKGALAWQHAQLFRQNMESVGDFPFEVTVRLMPGES